MKNSPQIIETTVGPDTTNKRPGPVERKMRPLSLEVSKSQQVRIVDILALGPFMIYAGAREKLSGVERAVLIVAGIATIAYNARNYALTAAPAANTTQNS